MHVFNNNTTHTISERKLSSTRSAQTVRILAQRWEPMRWQKKNSCNYSYNKLQNKDEKKLSLAVGAFLLLRGGGEAKHINLVHLPL